jgi:peptidoglycan-N-acetylglucosamine deacetylase
MSEMLHALSFDVEEWYHAELVRQHVSPEQMTTQVEAATAPILELLARRRLHATFFVVGEIVLSHPALLREIVSAGHEIGCHTMSHLPLWRSSPGALREELQAFRQALDAALPGALPPVAGFRAPTFSLNRATSWALEVLASEGYRYDSSIFPVANPVYGVSGAPLDIYRPSPADIRRADSLGAIVEFPMTVWTIAGLRLPVAGGFYLRGVPWPVLRRAMAATARQRPVVLYMHPWEAYSQTPVVRGLSPLDHFITYYNRSDALRRLECLLDELPFAPLARVLAPYLAEPGTTKATT